MCLPMIGGVVSAFGSIYSGMAQSAGYKAQAKAKEYEAKALSEEGAYASKQMEDRTRRLTGQQVTATAASGVDISGTPSDVIVDSNTEGEMDKQAIRRNAQFKSNLATYESKIAKMNAKSAKVGGMIGAISPLLSGVQSSFG